MAYNSSLVASFADWSNLLNYEEKMYVCAARTSLGCPSKTCRDHAHAILGSVSNVDIDRNNALQIKALGVIISTFETLPYPPHCLGMPRIFLTAPHPATVLGLHDDQGEQGWHL